MQIAGILFDPITSETTYLTVEDKLQTYYDLLECSTIDIVTRRINNTPFSFICDDEALLRECPVVSAMDKDMNPMLFGKLFIVDDEATEDGELTSINAEDIQVVLDAVKRITITSNGETKPKRISVLWPVSY